MSQYNCLRLYDHGKLITWSQRRCCRCQRFLGKKQKIYCTTCSSKRMKERDNLWNKIKQIVTRNSFRTIRELSGIQIPSSYYLILGEYT